LEFFFGGFLLWGHNRKSSATGQKNGGKINGPKAFAYLPDANRISWSAGVTIVVHHCFFRQGEQGVLSQNVFGKNKVTKDNQTTNARFHPTSKLFGTLGLFLFIFSPLRDSSFSFICSK
jgi:hypothetical protein